jgi:FixJ family two-component response regulator
MKIEYTSSLLAILDDDKSVQSALQDLIESEGMLALCFDSAEQFLDSGAKHKAACLIADIRMPGMSGIELQAKLKAERCRIPIIFITGRGDIPLAVSAMKEGASDFFTKPVDGNALLNSVERALQRDRANRQKATEHAGLVARYKSLTPREREVLPLLASGLLNKQVAFELGITECTVQLHRGHIMRKMEADSFATLVRMADKLTPNHQRHPTGTIRCPFLAAHSYRLDGTLAIRGILSAASGIAVRSDKEMEAAPRVSGGQ